MDLGKITARVRPRNPHEATDLGIVMARRWFRPLLLLGALPSFPLMLLLFFLFREQPWWAALILWWLKPLWETLQLQFIAEALFNPQIRWQAVLKQAPHHLLRDILPKLLVQRWSLSRSFNMPVGELEQLKGDERSRRLAVLHRDGSSTSVWLTLFGNTVEGLLVLALFGAAWMLVPMEMEIDFSLTDLLDSPLLFPSLAWSAWLAMTLVSPFYVCCGFMLYINRRTWLEAWDIELVFRQLAHKVRQARNTLAALFMLLVIPLLGGIPQPSYAELTPHEAQQQIIEILESDDFNEMKEKSELQWSARQEQSNTDWLQRQLDRLKDSTVLNALLRLMNRIPNVLEALLWGVAIALLVFLIYRFRHLIVPTLRQHAPSSTTPRPTQLFGLDLSRQSLPDDPLALARQLWQQQRQREALSLLYRAALSHLVHQDQVPLEESHTENECVALCRRTVDTFRADYFQQLTRHWIKLAYAHHLPDNASFERLCEHWQSFTQRGADT